MSSLSSETYRGGVPFLYTRGPGGHQRGAGFFSTIKRFLMPIGKAVLPSVFGGVSDLMSGKPVGETLKERGSHAAKSAFSAVADTLNDREPTELRPPPPPPSKGYKRKRAPSSSPKAKRKKLNNSNWK